VPGQFLCNKLVRHTQISPRAPVTHDATSQTVQHQLPRCYSTGAQLATVLSCGMPHAQNSTGTLALPASDGSLDHLQGLEAEMRDHCCMKCDFSSAPRCVATATT